MRSVRFTRVALLDVMFCVYRPDLNGLPCLQSGRYSLISGFTECREGHPEQECYSPVACGVGAGFLTTRLGLPRK